MSDKLKQISVLSLITHHSPLFDSRSDELEHLDLGDYTAAEYEGCLAELRRINRWLGDAGALRRTLLRSLKKTNHESLSVLDVGAGSGEMLRVIARWARNEVRRMRLVGLELNARSAVALQEESTAFDEIAALRGNAFHLPFADESFDYVMCSLFTHHFRDDEVIRVLREMMRVARRGVVVIDLHRHQIAYLLYITLGRLILHNRLTREDGALSIRRGFRPQELQALVARAGLTDARISRRFPFRLVIEANKQETGQLI